MADTTQIRKKVQEIEEKLKELNSLLGPVTQMVDFTSEAKARKERAAAKAAAGFEKLRLSKIEENERHLKNAGFVRVFSDPKGSETWSTQGGAKRIIISKGTFTATTKEGQVLVSAVNVDYLGTFLAKK